MTTRKKTFQIEPALAELEQIVEHMESGNLTLEDSLKHFEKGINLTKKCQESLAKAEQKIQLLSAKNGEESLLDFEPSSTETA